MGIISVGMIMDFHLIFSVLAVSRNDLVGCQLVGVIGIFATFASAAYHFFLSSLIDTLSKLYNPKELSHRKYHFFSIICGLFFSMMSILLHDNGLNVSYILD